MPYPAGKHVEVFSCQNPGIFSPFPFGNIINQALDKLAIIEGIDLADKFNVNSPAGLRNQRNIFVPDVSGLLKF